MKLYLEQNLGDLDREVRIWLGTILLASGTLIVDGMIGMVLSFLSLPILFFAIIGFCPAYAAVGISTTGQATLGPKRAKSFTRASKGSPMTREEKKKPIDRGQRGYGFRFRSPEEMMEMMRKCCPSQDRRL